MNGTVLALRVFVLAVAIYGFSSSTLAEEPSDGGGGDTPAPPDSDGDTVDDAADQCPNQPGHVNSPFGPGCPCSFSDGVPDADCDGISDYIDGGLDYNGDVDDQYQPPETEGGNEGGAGGGNDGGSPGTTPLFRPRNEPGNRRNRTRRSMAPTV